MSPFEANKIIAQFMASEGNALQGINYISLDSLVPVWEALRDEMLLPFSVAMGDSINHGQYFFSFEEKSIHDVYMEEVNTFSIQESAAIATAKAIQETGV